MVLRGRLPESVRGVSLGMMRDRFGSFPDAEYNSSRVAGFG